MSDLENLYNLDAEQGVIGSVLINPGCYLELASLLTFADFHDERHQWIWQAFGHLHAQAMAIDFLTISEELQRAGQLQEAGGDAYLASLVSALPTSLHALDYARIVKDKARKLRGERLAQELVKAIKSPNGSLDITGPGILDDLRAELFPQAALADTWQAYTLADAFQERPPVEYAVQGIFPLPSVSIVYGAPGSLKSMILADMAICVAAGLDWLPGAPWLEGQTFQALKVKQGPVMWLDFDNGERMTSDRFAALARARDLPLDCPLTYYSMPTPWLDASDKAQMGDLIERVQATGSRLVMVDNLGVIIGETDENSPDMARVMSFWRQVSEATGAAIVLIHHQRKSTGSKARAGESLRGHSSIEAYINLALLVEREQNTDRVILKATKVRGESVPTHAAEFTFERDEHGGLMSCKFFGLPAIEPETGQDLGAPQTYVLNYLDEHGPSSKTELEKNAKGCKAGSVKNAIYALSALGRIVRTNVNAPGNQTAIYQLVTLGGDDLD